MFCLNIHQTSHSFFLLFVVADVIKTAVCSVLNPVYLGSETRVAIGVYSWGMII